MVQTTLYLVCRNFEIGKGSYAGVFESLAKHASSQGLKVIILAARCSKEQKLSEIFPYAEVIRFKIPLLNIPILGMNFDYLLLAWHVRRFFQKEMGSNDIILANGPAALGLIGKKYVLRSGQVAFRFLSNMEIAKREASTITRIGRLLHYSFQSVLEYICFRSANALLLPSMDTYNDVTRFYRCKKKPYMIPFAGVDTEKFLSLKRKLSKERNILFISAGDERLRKGVVYFERAIPNILKKFSDIKIISIGSMPLTVPAWCKERIIVKGKVPHDRMNEYYSSATIVLACALNEGFPNALIEAMASGTPIATSDIDGIHEYITHLKEGYIFKRGSSEEIETAVQYLLEHADRREKIGFAARKRILQLDYDNYYSTVLNFLKGSTTGRSDEKNINLLLRDFQS